MPYDEVYFCGKCQDQRSASSDNEHCKVCHNLRISYNPSRETEESATKRWKILNNK